MGISSNLNEETEKLYLSKANWLKIIILSGIILTIYFSCSSQPTITLICGDVDESGVVDILDAYSIIDYIFAGKEAPEPFELGDVDCSGGVDILMMW